LRFAKPRANVQKSMEEVMPKEMPPQGLLKSVIDYDPQTGVATWKPRNEAKRSPPLTFNACFAGKPVGTKMRAGHLLVNVMGSRYLLHRVIWTIVTGETVFDEIDHINGDPADNRFCNLRVATHYQNMTNRKKPESNTSGVMGVSWHAQGKGWRAYITINGKQKSLGIHANIEDAIAARQKAVAENKFHKNHGR
jgi:hypothetical protein